MGAIHEKTTDRGPTSGGDQGVGSGGSDGGDSAGGTGGGQASIRVCPGAGPVQGRNFTSGKSSLDRPRREKFATGVRASVGNSTRASGLHCQEVGRGRDKKAGNQKMKTLVVANQKGGVGKTSAVVHLAFDFFERGLRVLVIDLDTQANASYSLQEFDSGFLASQMFEADAILPNSWFKDLPEGPVVQLIAADAPLANMEKRVLADVAASFKDNLKTFADCGFDVCLIDTAPALGASMAAALFSGDYVLSPIELESYSIQGIEKMVKTIVNVRKANPGLQFLGMLPSKVDGRNPRHGQHLEELEKAYPQLLVPVSVGLRSSIADALASCVPVWKIQKTAARKATQEIRALAAHVFERMEITK